MTLMVRLEAITTALCFWYGGSRWRRYLQNRLAQCSSHYVIKENEVKKQRGAIEMNPMVQVALPRLVQEASKMKWHTELRVLSCVYWAFA
ncbi:hypothetical protein A2U01_0026878, partial [Trifolium medium]|nr:hypothetical protein [Trifolium medium]